MQQWNDCNSFAQTRNQSVSVRAASGLQKPTSILICDTRQLVLESVAALMRSRIENAVIQTKFSLEDLDLEPTFIVVLESSCGRQALESLTARARRLAPRSRLLALMDASEREHIEVANAFGICCIHDIQSLNELIENGSRRTTTAHAPVRHIGGTIDWPADEGRSSGAGARSPGLQQLTPRERDVLQRVDRGLPNKVIAYELGISCCTVKIHIRNIMQKLKARNRTQAVFLARQLPIQTFASV